MSKQTSNYLTWVTILINCLIIALIQLVFVRMAIATSSTDIPDELITGRDVYNYYCYQCHAYSGDAKTLASTFLDPKPRNFTAASLTSLTRETMISAVSHGRSGTAMMSFASVLDNHEIESVVDYIRERLMSSDAQQLRYHTDANGWPQHDRYAIAYPFVNGEIRLDTPWGKLDKQQQAGKRLYMNACISCHDHGEASRSNQIWEIRAVSYPRKHYSHKLEKIDALSGASVHELHEQAIPEAGLSGQERQGRQLYLDNCAFCHAPDGSSRNWIGSFLDQGPRDFTVDNFIARSSDEYLQRVILEGLPGTSMPAWKQVLNKEQITDIVVFLRRAFGARQLTAE